MKVGLNVKGDAAFRANLQKIASLSKADINKVMEDALEPMRAATEQNARQLREPGTPKGGHLDEGIVAKKITRQSSRNKIVWWVTFVRRARKIAHLVEFGTAPHQQPNRKRKHPGARPRPFFRPAFDAHSSEVLSELAQRVREALLLGIK